MNNFTSGSGAIAIEENRSGVWTLLASTTIQKAAIYNLTYLPTTSQIRLTMTGPLRLQMKTICITKQVQVQQSFLVDICSGLKDRYRFGFNGQEKVNEWSGVGNFMDYGERGEDTRIARLNYSLDPKMKQFPYLTPYQFASNSPIQAVDLDGLEGVKYTDIEKRTITVSVTIDYIEKIPERNGSGMSLQQIEKTKNSMYKELNKKQFKDNVTGYAVIFDVKFKSDVHISGSFFNSNIMEDNMFLRYAPKSSSSVINEDGQKVTSTTEGGSSWRFECSRSFRRTYHCT